MSRSDALLDAAPVDDGSGLEEAQLAAKAPALLLHVHQGWLAEDDVVDGGGRGRERGAR